MADSIAALVGQLSSSAKAPSQDELEAIVDAPGTVLLAVRQSGRLVGMLTLVTFAIPTGVRAIIEDVVVDEQCRGQGMAEALTREALVLAESAGARTIDLTSRPSREAANCLYQKLGFQKRDSNVYRYTLPMKHTSAPARNAAPPHVLPDLIKPGLRIVFCGTAAGTVSAARGAYYAHPQNRFWTALHAFGLTPRKLNPEEYNELPQWGLGLTDIAKHMSGMDRELPAGALGTDACGCAYGEDRGR